MWLSCKKHREFHLMKILNVHKKKSILKTAGEKDQVPIRETLDSSMESLGMERTGRMVYRFWQNTNDRLYFTKLSLIIEEKNTFNDKRFIEFYFTKPDLLRLLERNWKNKGEVSGRILWRIPLDLQMTILPNLSNEMEKQEALPNCMKPVLQILKKI